MLLLNSVTEVAEGSVVSVPGSERRATQSVFQVTITGGTATVKLYGRADPDLDWHLVGAYTASDADLVALFPQMKAEVTAISGATVSAGLGF